MILIIIIVDLWLYNYEGGGECSLSPSVYIYIP